MAARKKRFTVPVEESTGSVVRFVSGYDIRAGRTYKRVDANGTFVAKIKPDPKWSDTTGNQWVDCNVPGREYHMLDKSVNKMLRIPHEVGPDGEVEGTWTYAGHGGTYGIEYVGPAGYNPTPDDFVKKGKTLVVKHLIPEELLDGGAEREAITALVLSDVQSVARSALADLLG